MHAFLQTICQRITYFDGGMGTMLQAMGLKGGEQPERWNLTRPEDVKSVYRAYLNAGADVVTANTFGANPLHFPTDWEQVLRAGLKQAREALAETGCDAFVAMEKAMPTVEDFNPWHQAQKTPGTRMRALAAEAAFRRCRGGCDQKR